MLERGHFQVLQAASEKVAEHAKAENWDGVKLASAQVQAIQEIQEVTTEILRKWGVPDIDYSKSSVHTQTDNTEIPSQLVGQTITDVIEGTFSTQLRTYRKGIRVPVQVFEEITGINASTISRYETQAPTKRGPRLYLILRLVEGLGLNSDQARSFLESAGYSPDLLLLPEEELKKLKTQKKK